MRTGGSSISVVVRTQLVEVLFGRRGVERDADLRVADDALLLFIVCFVSFTTALSLSSQHITLEVRAFRDATTFLDIRVMLTQQVGMLVSKLLSRTPR